MMIKLQIRVVVLILTSFITVNSLSQENYVPENGNKLYSQHSIEFEPIFGIGYSCFGLTGNKTGFGLSTSFGFNIRYLVNYFPSAGHNLIFEYASSRFFFRHILSDRFLTELGIVGSYGDINNLDNISKYHGIGTQLSLFWGSAKIMLGLNFKYSYMLPIVMSEEIKATDMLTFFPSLRYNINKLKQQ